MLGVWGVGCACPGWGGRAENPEDSHEGDWLKTNMTVAPSGVCHQEEPECVTQKEFF